MKPTTRALLTLLALGLTLATAWALAAPSRAATLEATSRVYLPLVTCPSCTGSGQAATLVPTATPVATATPVPPPDLAANVARMVELVNGARAAAGCPAAVPSAILMRATQDWTNHMAATYDYQHAPSNWYTEPPYYYPTNGVLENITGGTSVDDAFTGWMDSPLHKRNIEWCYPIGSIDYDPAIRYEIGVGAAGGYWTLAIGIP